LTLIDRTDNPGTDYPVCPICSRPCDDKPTSVACDICNSWLHYECENITPEEETKLDDPGTNYICILCTYQHDTMNSICLISVLGHSGCFPRFHVFISCVCKILPAVFSNFTVNVLTFIIMIQNCEEFTIVTINYLKSQNLILKTTQTTDKHEAVVSESVSVYQNSSKLFVLNHPAKFLFEGICYVTTETFCKFSKL
jgi:hypothetical protein